MRKLISTNWGGATKLYKLTTLIVLINLIASNLLLLSKIDFGKTPIYLLFSLPLFWLLWIACVIFEKERSGFKLAVLWIFIDISVFGVVKLLTYGVVNSANSGEDFMFAIAFAPLVAPWLVVSLAFPMAADILSAISHGASTVLLHNRNAGPLTSWLEFSILSAISSALFIYFFNLVKYLRKKYRNSFESPEKENAKPRILG